ncbi:hypothetical protein L208DRAFT_1255592 [Tricholoma matsutake]|nr:hypothetical protein L208DRAFT_1255592 [Tricholoma matsutake 945]
MSEFHHNQYAVERLENIYYPFASTDEWELAAFLLWSDLSMRSIDSFLSLKLVKNLNLSFGTAKHLCGLAEMLPKGPEWRCKCWDTAYPTKKKLDLFYRDPLECIQSILSNPLMKSHLQFSLLHIFDSAVRAMRIYTEWLTGDVAWSMQVSPLD